MDASELTFPRAQPLETLCHNPIWDNWTGTMYPTVIIPLFTLLPSHSSSIFEIYELSKFPRFFREFVIIENFEMVICFDSAKIHRDSQEGDEYLTTPPQL